MKPLSLGYSPCPNDTYIFSAWTEGRIPDAPPVETRWEDIETLNRLAAEEALDVAKVSFHAFGHLRENYCLLHSGGALGRGCGPLVVAKEAWSPEELSGKRIAIPGRWTTAALLFQLFAPDAADLVVMPFHEILPATRDGRVDAGLIIHESRFTYPGYGLKQVVDLGEWWETQTGQAIPLGGIIARRSLGKEVLSSIDAAIRSSLHFASLHPEEIWPTIRSHAQEMDDEVMRQHIALYVNPFTEDYGEEGEAAIRYLLNTAENLGIVPKTEEPLFWDECESLVSSSGFSTPSNSSFRMVNTTKYLFLFFFIFIYRIGIFLFCEKIRNTRVLHDPGNAAQVATQFIQASFIKRDYAIAAELRSVFISESRIKYMAHKYHPDGFPTEVRATDYRVVEGIGRRQINIMLQGKNDEKVFYYHLIMIGDADNGYKVDVAAREMNGPNEFHHQLTPL